MTGDAHPRPRVHFPPAGGEWRPRPAVLRAFAAHGRGMAVLACGDACIYRTRAGNDASHPGFACICRPRAGNGDRDLRFCVRLPPTGRKRRLAPGFCVLFPPTGGKCLGRGRYHVRSAARTWAMVRSSARSSSSSTHSSDSVRICSRLRRTSAASSAWRSTSERVSPGPRSPSMRANVCSSARNLITAIRLYYTRVLCTAPASRGRALFLHFPLTGGIR